jgi:hypothetical protein
LLPPLDGVFGELVVVDIILAGWHDRSGRCIRGNG